MAWMINVRRSPSDLFPKQMAIPMQGMISCGEFAVKSISASSHMHPCGRMPARFFFSGAGPPCIPFGKSGTAGMPRPAVRRAHLHLRRSGSIEKVSEQF
jgi:hypothetical protein